ncbi:hypothetical protein LWP59_00385 [Amycolatopsis acidiphila]|uniref:MFS transporter n=1 Tax=Amycolatopsis acidiphila TaxID=715473 RepID=A0A558AFX1_9PSEU|nr:MFS transporter [Amycolatopsis acidiphila]TVT23116.1 MFS transporter [Amycolatopsis acidiphila]UIJ60198.1 hypothetical protein LWP59_00385 [Amycolatopsis acidiphila]GHG60830.1 hypothetical protein GCM10017788_14870 [Amycolatopsis acidiphila]
MASLLSSRLVSRHGHRVVPLGLSVQLLGLLTLVVTVPAAWPNLDVLDLAPGMLVTGAGQGLAAPTLFRVILSRVPAGSAGVGSGMLTTTQQTSPVLGVAALGTLFAALSTTGMATALVTVLLVQAAMTALVALAARRLPDPRG